MSMNRLLGAAFTLALTTAACGPQELGDELNTADAALESPAGVYVADSEGPTATGGKRASGTYTNTRALDGSAEMLQEVKTYSDQIKLYWAWTINNVPAGTYTLRVVARKDTADNEPFSITLRNGSSVTYRLCQFTTTSWSNCSQTVTLGTSGSVQLEVSDAPGWEYDDPTNVYVDYVALVKQ